MTINTDNKTERGLGDFFKDVFADPEVRAGVKDLVRNAGRLATDAWTRHRGNEVVVTFVRSALATRR